MPSSAPVICGAEPAALLLSIPEVLRVSAESFCAVSLLMTLRSSAAAIHIPARYSAGTVHQTVL